MSEVKHYFWIAVTAIASLLLAYIVVNALYPLILFVAWLMLIITLLELFVKGSEEFFRTAIGKVALILSLTEWEAYIVVVVAIGVVVGLLSAYIVLSLSPLVKVITYVLIALNVFVRLLKWLDPKGYELLSESLRG